MVLKTLSLTSSLQYDEEPAEEPQKHYDEDAGQVA